MTLISFKQVPNINLPHELHVKSNKDEILAYVFEENTDDSGNANQVQNASERTKDTVALNSVVKSICSTPPETFASKRPVTGSFSDLSENVWLQNEMNGNFNSKICFLFKSYTFCYNWKYTITHFEARTRLVSAFQFKWHHSLSSC